MPHTVKRTVLVTIAATLGGLALLAAGGGAAVLFGGWYDVGATRQHWQPVHTLLETGMRYAVRHHARAIVPPPPGAERALRGAQVYRAVCQQCHGGPGAAQTDIGKSMQPVPGPLVDASDHWRPRELYWITRHGIKMSGMPAWRHHLADEDIWAVVAFLGRLPRLSAREYAAMTGQGAVDGDAAQVRAAGAGAASAAASSFGGNAAAPPRPQTGWPAVPPDLGAPAPARAAGAASAAASSLVGNSAAPPRSHTGRPAALR
jgi:hypothetical protein